MNPQLSSITNIPLSQLLAFGLGLITLLGLNQYSIYCKNINLGQGIEFLNQRDD